MQKVCDVLEQLLNGGVVGKYAIGGATAAGFRLPHAGPQGFANKVESKPNFNCGRGSGGGRRGIPKKCLGKMKDVAGHGRTILWN